MKPQVFFLFMLIILSACQPQVTSVSSPTPTTAIDTSSATVIDESRPDTDVNVPLTAPYSLRLYNMIADLNYFELDSPNENISFGPTAKGAVTAYVDIQTLEEPFYLLYSYSDAVEVLGPYDIAAYMVPGENTIAINVIRGEAQFTVMDNNVDLSSEPSVEEILMFVGPHTIPCEEGDKETFCYQVKFSDTDEWQPLDIWRVAQFNHRPGYQSKLTVFKFDDSRTELIHYKLVDILEQTQVSNND